MKVNELSNSTANELELKNIEMSKELFNLRFQLHTGRLENTSKISQLRKNIARVNTILREKRG
jgi:large subunit ribosomal protein L29